MDIRLEDLIPVYSDWDNSEDRENLQRFLTEKEEFRELASSISEAPSQRGEFFKHQLLIRRFLSHYDRLFLFHRPGTGKSCAIISAAEYARDQFEKGGMIKKVIIITKSEQLINDFKKQLVCRCTSGRYETESVTGAKSIQAQKVNVTKAIKKWYEITTHRTFAIMLRDEYANDEKMIKKFSGVLFFLDEVHSIIPDQDSRYEKPEESEHGPTEKKKSINNREVYRQFHRLFHAVKRSKVVVASATPMINQEKEIAPVMNLLLPLTRQMPWDARYDTWTAEDFKPYFEGIISYIRELDTGAIPVYQGVEIDINLKNGYTTQIILSQDYMVKFDPGVVESPETEISQATGYLKSLQDDEGRQSGGTDEDHRGSQDSIYQDSRQASIFVFPDGSYGTNGFNKYVQTVEVDIFKPKADLLPYISYPGDTEKTLDLIATRSIKFSNICRSIMEGEGACFVYVNYVKTGAALLAICLEQLGFEQFTEKESIFVGKSGRIKPYCAPDRLDSESRFVRPGFRARPRFALLIGEMSATRNDAIMEAMNSYENRNGDYIKVLIASRVGRDGINVNNSRQIHIVGPEWNRSTLTQAMFRAIRSNSHVALIEDEKQRLISRGMSEEEAEDKVKININVYLHSAVYQAETYEILIEPGMVDPYPEIVRRINEYLERKHSADKLYIEFKRGDELELFLEITDKEPDPELLRQEIISHEGWTLLFTLENSIDRKMYLISEEKDIKIKRIERFMKQYAIDCQIHYERNFRSTDVNGSAACDYQSCEYRCLGQSPGFRDYSTYDLLYAQERIDMVMEEIVQMFKDRDVIRWSELSLDTPRIMLFAVERLISEKIQIYDRNGFICYLTEDGDLLFLRRSIEPIKYIDSLYTSTLLGLETISLSDYNTRRAMITGVQAAETIDGTIEEIKQRLDDMTIEQRIGFFEQSVIRYLRGDRSEKMEQVIDLFKSFYLRIPEPIEAIRELAERPVIVGGRGRPRNIPEPGEARRTPRVHSYEEVEIMGTGPEVWIHKLYSQKTESEQKYAVTTKLMKAEGTIRILKPSVSLEWQDANEYEKEIYSKIFQIEFNKELKKLDERGPIGILSKDGFRLRDKTREGNKATTDQRSVNRGKICSTWVKAAMADLMFRVDYPMIVREGTRLPSKEEMISYISSKKDRYSLSEIQSWDDRRIEYYYRMNLALEAFTKPAICEMIKEYMVATNRVMVVE